MSLAQDRLVLAAWALAESAWLFAGLGLAGLAMGTQGSPLGLPAVLVIIGCSLMIGRGLNSIIIPSFVASVVQMALGALVLYITLGTQGGSGDGGLDLAWINHLGSEAGGETRTVVLASLFAVGLWWRGGRLAASDSPTQDLGGSFKLGIMVLAPAILVDAASPEELNIYPTMFLFFGAGIGGMSIGQVLPASMRAVEERAWPRVIAAVVSAVVVIGLLFSLLQENVLSLLSTPAQAVLGALGKAVFFVFVLPMAYIVGFLAQALISLLNFFSRGEVVDSQTLGDFGQFVLEQEQQEGGTPGFLAYIEWALVALVVVVALYILARTFRRRSRWRRVHKEGARESVWEDADPANDLARLLFNLIPQRFRQAKRRLRFRLSEDEQGVIDVFRVYFGLLALAEKKGHPRPPAQTPLEYQRTLEDVFPQALVRAVTAAFVRACYGHHSAPRDQIEEMRLSLERLTAEKA